MTVQNEPSDDFDQTVHMLGGTFSNVEVHFLFCLRAGAINKAEHTWNTDHSLFLMVASFAFTFMSASTGATVGILITTLIISICHRSNTYLINTNTYKENTARYYNLVKLKSW